MSTYLPAGRCRRVAVTPLIAGALLAAPLAAQQTTDPFAGIERVPVMLLGTFHFDDPGLDDYKPAFPWNPLTPEHQREIAEVVERLVAWGPTVVAVEWPAARQAALDSAYAAFREGPEPEVADERHQIGFRLAARLGLSRVHAVDAPARSYFPDMTSEEYEARAAGLTARADPALVARQVAIDAAYQRLHRQDDSLKTVVPLARHLAAINAPGALLVSHGQYLTGGFLLGDGDDYLGPDMRTRWYNRNLRIFHNVRRLVASGDRVLVLIGAGHVPILRHAVEASPELDLVEVGPHLAGG